MKPNSERAYFSKAQPEMPLFAQQPFTPAQNIDSAGKDQWVVDRAYARNADVSTSHEAAKSVCNLGRTRDAILRILRAIGPATDEQISDYYEQYVLDPVSPSGLRSRRSELVTLGLVEDSGKTAKTASGRKSVVWRLAK